MACANGANGVKHVEERCKRVGEMGVMSRCCFSSSGCLLLLLVISLFVFVCFSSFCWFVVFLCWFLGCCMVLFVGVSMVLPKKKCCWWWCFFGDCGELVAIFGLQRVPANGGDFLLRKNPGQTDSSYHVKATAGNVCEISRSLYTLKFKEENPV